MQSLDSGIPQPFQNTRIEVSKLFYRSKSASITKRNSLISTKSTQFVPFLNERDSLGRLLSKKLYDVNLHFSQTLNSSPEQHRKQKQRVESIAMMKNPWFRDLQLSNKINQNPQKSLKMDIFKQESHYFKLSDLHKKKQRKRIKIEEHQYQNCKQSKKQPQMHKQFIIFEQPETHLRKVKSAVMKRRNKNNEKQQFQFQTRPKVQIRQQFYYFVDEMKKIEQKVKLLPEKKRKANDRQANNEFNPLKESSNELTLIGKNKQHPQLQRFNKMQSLSVKLFTNFQQGHQRLIKNVKNAKMDAVRIKKQLQHDF